MKQWKRLGRESMKSVDLVIFRVVGLNERRDATASANFHGAALLWGVALRGLRESPLLRRSHEVSEIGMFQSTEFISQRKASKKDY
jgi:hypothetical protein